MSKKYNTLKDTKQDLIAARAQLKEFRREVSLLKKKGLLDKKLYDARSVTPSKYLKSQIKKFKDVIVGHATTAKVNKENQAYYKKQGYKIKNGLVIVPTLHNEKVISTHGNFSVVTRSSSGKVSTIELTNLPRENIQIWSEELAKRHVKLVKD